MFTIDECTGKENVNVPMVAPFSFDSTHRKSIEKASKRSWSCEDAESSIDFFRFGKLERENQMKVSKACTNSVHETIQQMVSGIKTPFNKWESQYDL